jgi:hypothetical protein
MTNISIDRGEKYFTISVISDDVGALELCQASLKRQLGAQVNFHLERRQFIATLEAEQSLRTWASICQETAGAVTTTFNEQDSVQTTGRKGQAG